MRFIMNLQNSSGILIKNLINIFKGLLLSVILLYFTSCNEVDSIGSSFQDEGVLLNTFFSDTFTIKTSVKLIDSVATSSNMLAGAETDEKFGQTNTESFFKLFIPNEYDEDFIASDNNAIFDSARLVLRYTLISGDENVSQDFELLELNEIINDTILYYQNSIIGVENTVVGSASLIPAEDSLNTLSFEADAIGEKLFESRTDVNMLDQGLFETNIFQGINIRPVDSIADAYTLSFVQPPNSAVDFIFRLYFSLPEDTVSSIQNFFVGPRFFKVNSDFTNTPFLSDLKSQKEISTELTNNEWYIQSGAGITTKLEFPWLAEFASQNPNIAINKAELTFDPILASQDIHGLPPSTLGFFVLDGNGDFNVNFVLLQEGRTAETVTEEVPQNVPITSLNLPFLSASYRLGAGTYPIVDITSYMQEVIKGQRSNNGILINPFIARGSIARGIFGDNTISEEALKLRLFYTTNEVRD